MNELIIDQIPNLSDVLKTLEQMSIMNTNAQSTRNPFVVQQLPELRRSITEGRDWQAIAEYQLSTYFTKESEAAEFDDLVKFAEMYSGTNIDALSEGFKCAHCLKTATQRCSRCKSVWYCSRECQVDHYKKEHKHVCKTLAAKVAENSDKNHVTGSAMIFKPSEVKAQGKKSKEVSGGKKAEENTEKRIKVEVLNSTDSKDGKEAEMPKKPEPLQETTAKKPDSPQPSQNQTGKEKQEDENPMEELD